MHEQSGFQRLEALWVWPMKYVYGCRCFNDEPVMASSRRSHFSSCLNGRSEGVLCFRWRTARRLYLRASPHQLGQIEGTNPDDTYL